MVEKLDNRNFLINSSSKILTFKIFCYWMVSYKDMKFQTCSKVQTSLNSSTHQPHLHVSAQHVRLSRVKTHLLHQIPLDSLDDRKYKKTTDKRERERELASVCKLTGSMMLRPRQKQQQQAAEERPP